MQNAFARVGVIAVLSVTLAAAAAAQQPKAAKQASVVTIDRLVAHASTVPAVKGQRVDLFVREKVGEGALRAQSGASFNGRVVLMVHGGYSPGVLAFDVPYRDYSWAEFLARAGYDVFVMDMTGYGRSSRPMMDDPCNLARNFQKMVIPKTLKEGCEPNYKFELVNSDSETDDINAVVDYIRKLRGVAKINVIGWSGGGIRLGTFVSRHQEKVERFVILASSNYSRKNPDERPAELPKAGAPTTIQSREVGIDQRWLGTSKCADSIEPGMPEYIWGLNAEHDPLGATWGSGGLRAPTRTYWGWNANAAKKITVPTLIMVGEQDELMKSNLELIDDLGASSKVFLSIACATHFVVWEKQRRILYRASLEWLRTGRLSGRNTGSFRADERGTIQATK
jgi:pimeloyl-ACP methyl ester carboxylesterase